MTDSACDPTGEFAAWLAAQTAVLQSLAQERDPARLRSELETWWRRAGAQAAPQAQQVAARFFDLGERYLQGLQQFARAAAGEQLETTPGGANFGLDFLAAWRNARWGDSFGADAAGVMFAPWLDAIAKMPATGAAGAFVNDARELAALNAQCQHIEAALTALLQNVQHEALADLHSRIAQRAQSNDPIRDFHQLYKLWIDCGERAYARAAHDAEFIKLQADFANHALRIRILQRRLAERMARSLDLPTRDEVNSLHLQVRDLKRRLNRCEQQDAARATPKARRTP